MMATRARFCISSLANKTKQATMAITNTVCRIDLCLCYKQFSTHEGSDRARSVVHEEVEKFARASDDWWDPASTSGAGPLHLMNPVRVNYIRRRVQAIGSAGVCDATPFEGLRILDVGCGGGILSESLARLGANVLGIDMNAKGIDVAKRHAKTDPLLSKQRLEYRYVSTEELVNEEELKFDVVCALEVVEHVADVPSFLECCSQLVKPGGSMFVSTLNRTTKSLAAGIIAAEHILNLVPQGTHEWSKFVTPGELHSALCVSGLQVVDQVGMRPDPLALLCAGNSRGANTDGRSLSLPLSIAGHRPVWSECQSLDVNYIVHAQKRF